jgi:predicted alpha/beta superfamily hydrolase
MKTLSALFITVLLMTGLQAQKVINKEFNSLELGETRLIRIYTPPSYEKDKDRLFPLTIVFDGEMLFDPFVGNASLFAVRDKAPEQIIVGIYQGEKREDDCGFDTVTSLPNEISNRFYRFVRGELLQFLQTNYRLSPFRTLAGYGLTANFVNYFAIEDVPAFDAYVLINPVIAPDLPGFLQNTFERVNDRIIYYYLNSGTYHIESKKKPIENTFKVIQMLNNENIRLTYDYFDTTPTASISFAIASSLAHIFDIYSAISNEEYKKNVAHLDPPDAIAYLENKYVEIEYLFGTHMKIRERDIFAIEPIIIDTEDGLYLEDFGNMILKLYPESPIGDYYIGLFYEKARKYKQALKHYKNGYAKMNNDSRDAEAYYGNIERILELQKTEKELEEAEKLARKAEKEAEKAEREEQKALYKEQKEKEKAEREKQKEFYQQQKEKEKEMKEKNQENDKQRRRRRGRG